jgi:hypothetical protein
MTGYETTPNWFRREAVPQLKLTPGMIAVYQAIAGRANRQGECYPSHKRIALESGVHPSSVGRIVTQLIARNLIAVVSVKKGRTHRYRICERPPELLTEVSASGGTKGESASGATKDLQSASGGTKGAPVMGVPPEAVGGTASGVDTERLMRDEGSTGRKPPEGVSSQEASANAHAATAWGPSPLPRSHERTDDDRRSASAPPSSDRLALLHDLELLGGGHVLPAGFLDGLTALEVGRAILDALEVLEEGTPHGCAMPLDVGRPDLWAALEHEGVRAAIRDNCERDDLLGALTVLVADAVADPPHVAVPTIDHDPHHALAHARHTEGTQP